MAMRLSVWLFSRWSFWGLGERTAGWLGVVIQMAAGVMAGLRLHNSGRRREV